MSARPSNWLKVVFHAPPVTSEAVSELLFQAGAKGLWEDSPDDQGRLVTMAGFVEEDGARLADLLPGLAERLAEAFDLAAGDFHFSLELEENHDWAEKWKEGLAPFTAGPRLAVAPTWWPEKDLPEREVVLRIDPGLAFGSGHHATTFMCLTSLAELAPAAKRILDVGAGSGILALACAALNPAAVVIGVDNDPETVEVAEGNAAANGLTGRVDFSDRPLDRLDPPFDLIVANITSNPLMELAPGLTGLAGPGARLVLSGLPETQAPEVYEVYGRLGWLGGEISRLDGWEARVFTRPVRPLAD